MFYRGAQLADNADFCAAMNACERKNRERDAQIHHSVCRINAYTEQVDVLEPYKDRESSKGVGTGFVIKVKDEMLVATAFHVVDEAVRLQLVFEQYFSGRPLNAHCIGGNPVLDVALLRIEDDDADLSTIPPIRTGDSDALTPLDVVSALGFALGQKHLQTSSGVISGRKATPNRIQADVAVNPGNSGGPALSDAGLVIGLVTSGHSHAQGLNYLAPMNESMKVFESILAAKGDKDAPHYTTGLSFNVHVAQMNDVLIRTIGCDSGVFVTTTNPLSTEESEQLLPSDVLCKIDIPNQNLSFPIDMQMRIQAPWARGKIEFHSILDRLDSSRGASGVDESEPIVFHVLRGANMDAPRAIKTTLQPSRYVLREMYPYIEPLRFVSRGGVVVQMLSENVQRKSSWIKRCRYADFPEMDMHSVLIITHIAPSSPFAHDDAIGIYDYVEAVNNHMTRRTASTDALQAFATSFAKEDANPVITLRMRDGTMASASQEQIKEYESQAAPKSVSIAGKVSVCTFRSGCQNVMG